MEATVPTTEQIISPAGDPSTVAGCYCYEGYHYIGYETEDGENGEEEYERVPCKRCNSFSEARTQKS
jgi:hypothetical protein